MTQVVNSTRRHRARAPLVGAMTALLAACSLGAVAHAEDASIKEAVFDAQSTFFAAIVKVANDGEKWTHVLPGSVGFDARLKVDTKWPGYVERVACYQCHIALDDLRFYAKTGRREEYTWARDRLLALVAADAAAG